MKSILPTLCLLCIAWLAWQPLVHGEVLSETFRAANEAYANGDFETAVARYRQLTDVGIMDAALAVNLANAYARAGFLGHALRWYELALVGSPRDADARQGLRATLKALGERRADQEGGRAVLDNHGFAEALVRSVSEFSLAAGLLLANLLLSAAVLGWRLQRGESARLSGGLAAGALVVTLFLGVALAIKRDVFAPGDPALVTSRETALREAPNVRAQQNGTLREGDRVWMLSAQAGFSEVVLPGGTRGWVRRDTIGSLRRP